MSTIFLSWGVTILCLVAELSGQPLGKQVAFSGLLSSPRSMMTAGPYSFVLQ
jgi:hypothetical protein